MREQRIMSQTKEQDKTSIEQLGEVEIANLSVRVQSSEHEEDPKTWRKNEELEDLTNLTKS